MAKLTREFVFRLKVHQKPAYRLAIEARCNPGFLYKITAGIVEPTLGDKRVIAVGRLLGLEAVDCFEPDASPEAVEVSA